MGNLPFLIVNQWRIKSKNPKRSVKGGRREEGGRSRGEGTTELSELQESSEWGKEKIVAIFCFHLPALFLFYSSVVPIVL